MEICILKTDNPFDVSKILNLVRDKFNDPRLHFTSNLNRIDDKSFYVITITHDLEDDTLLQDSKSYID